MRLLTVPKIVFNIHLLLTAQMALMVAVFSAGCQSAQPLHVSPQCVSPTDPDQSMQNIIDACLADKGRFDYAKLIEDSNLTNELNCSVTSLTASTENSTANDLNTYTACVLRAVAEVYPLKSLDKCPVDFYKEIFFTVTGKQMNLTQLADRCRQSGDWRIDFALWAPGQSGPFLRNVIYKQDLLNEQLDQAVRDYISSCAGIRIDHEKQRVLFGRKIWKRKEMFLTSYREQFGLSDVPLAAAMMPWATPQTQQLLADVPGFPEALLPLNNQLNDVLRDDEDNEKETPKFFPCGCH